MENSEKLRSMKDKDGKWLRMMENSDHREWWRMTSNPLPWSHTSNLQPGITKSAYKIQKSQRVPRKYKNHKERLENTKITKSAWKFQCRLPKFVIDKMKHYMKLWSFEIVPQCHPSSPCPCSSRVGSDHFQFRKACPAPPSSPPSGPRWTGEEKSKMSCKKTREQQGAKQEKGNKDKNQLF